MFGAPTSCFPALHHGYSLVYNPKTLNPDFVKGCIELPRQSGNIRKKSESAGLNLASLAKDLPEDINIVDHRRFENDFDVGYPDDPEVLIGSILKSAKRGLKSMDDIEKIMKKLLVAKIGPVSTLALRQYIVREIFN